MSRLEHLCKASLPGLRSLLPILGALIAIRYDETCIATSIPGLGPCKSTYCKPERRARPR
ncbi:MAG: hypothetical protein WBW61_00340 [Rhodanobacteraceae bacterium]